MSRDAEASSRAEEDGVQRLERLLHESGALLHPQHAAVIDIKTQLAKIYGNYAPYTLPSLPRPLKERKIQVSREDIFSYIIYGESIVRMYRGFMFQLCQDMLDVICKVDPGFTRERGVMLSEMNKTKLVLAKQNLASPGNLDNPVYRKQWERACLEKQFLNMYLAYYQNMFNRKKTATG